MSRQPKPYYRKAQDRWVCTIDGNRVTLGQDKKAAFEQFHKLMSDRGAVKASVHTVYGLTQVYLDWVEVNRSAGTYDNHKRCLKSFIESIGKTLKVAELRNHHVTKWVDSQEWNSTTKNDNISTVFRVINWAIEQGYINSSPLRKMKKPKRTRREVHYTDEQWALIKSHIKTRQFADFLDFIWATGCRPKEARNLEARHVDMTNDFILIPAAEAKGGIPRVIYMTPESKQVLQRVWKDSGKLFVNARGNAWTRDAIKCHLTRVSDKVGFRVICYGARHSYATRGIKNGVDTTVLSALMGHRDASMVAKVYAHIATDIEFLKAQAKNVATKRAGAGERATRE